MQTPAEKLQAAAVAMDKVDASGIYLEQKETNAQQHDESRTCGDENDGKQSNGPECHNESIAQAARNDDKEPEDGANECQWSLRARLAALVVTSCILVAPPLLLPLQDPAQGFLGNPSFFLGYNGYVCLFYIFASFARSHTLFKNLDGSCFAGDSPISRSGLFQKKTIFLILLSSFIIQLSFMAAALPWGSNLAHSYNILYVPPVVCGVIDLLAMCFVKKNSLGKDVKSWKIGLLVKDVGDMASLPMFLTFGAVSASQFLEGTLPNVGLMTPLFNTVLIKGFRGLFFKKVEYGIKFANLGSTYDDTGLHACITATLNFSRFVLLPYFSMTGGSHLMLGLVASDVVDSSSFVFKVLFWMRKLKAAETAEPSAPNVAKLEEGHAQEIEPQEAKAAKAAAELASTLHRRAEQYLVFLVCPFIYAVAVSLIVNRGNKKYYYLYSCVDNETLSNVLYMVLARTCIQYLILGSEFLFLRRKDLLERMVGLVDRAFEWRRISSIMCSTVFVGIIFTSCFYVQHDGLGFFEFFCEHA
jgi:hypothetical protein